MHDAGSCGDGRSWRHCSGGARLWPCARKLCSLGSSGCCSTCGRCSPRALGGGRGASSGPAAGVPQPAGGDSCSPPAAPRCAFRRPTPTLLRAPAPSGPAAGSRSSLSPRPHACPATQSSASAAASFDMINRRARTLWSGAAFKMRPEGRVPQHLVQPEPAARAAWGEQAHCNHSDSCPTRTASRFHAPTTPSGAPAAPHCLRGESSTMRSLLLVALMSCLLVANAQHGGGELKPRCRAPPVISRLDAKRSRSLRAVPVRLVASMRVLGRWWGQGSPRVGPLRATWYIWATAAARSPRRRRIRRHATPTPTCPQPLQVAWAAAASSPPTTPPAAAVSALAGAHGPGRARCDIRARVRPRAGGAPNPLPLPCHPPPTTDDDPTKPECKTFRRQMSGARRPFGLQRLLAGAAAVAAVRSLSLQSRIAPRSAAAWSAALPPEGLPALPSPRLKSGCLT